MAESPFRSGDHAVLPTEPEEKVVVQGKQSPQTSQESESEVSFGRKVLSKLSWIPPNCRWDPDNPPVFTMALNVLFGFAGCFTVANLYYRSSVSHTNGSRLSPLLLKQVGLQLGIEPGLHIVCLPDTLGYAAGLLFILPMGDFLKRRPFIISLVWCTASLWIGLCVTSRFEAFAALSFLTGVTTITPQLMLPLVAELAPVERRATFLSVVTSCTILGVLIARVLSGIVTEYTSWRVIYWIAFGTQYLVVILLWLFMPDYPSTNPSGLSYFQLLYSILQIFLRSPLLIQCCLMGFLNFVIFTNFWTTLTFLLASSPYNFNSLVIGCFGFIGILAILLIPPFSRAITDRFVPLFSSILGCTICLMGVIIGTYTGTFTIAGPIIQAFFIDLGAQTSQVANRTAMVNIDSKAGNRINTAYMIWVFTGQLSGTAVGNRLYAQGGWIRSGSASVGFSAGSLLVCFLRGPWEKGYAGWNGGWSIRKKSGPQKNDRESSTKRRDETSEGSVLDEGRHEPGEENLWSQRDRVLESERDSRVVHE